MSEQQNQNQQQTPQQQQNKGPEDTIRDGSLKATIWRRQGQQKDYFTTDLAKTYEDKNGNLKDTKSFGKNDLLGIAELARRANIRVNELTREEFKKNRQNGQNQQQNRGTQSH